MRLTALALAGLCLLPTAARADFLLIHPFPGSKTTDRRDTSDLLLPQGPVEGGKLSKSLELHGTVVVRTFKNPKGHDGDEVVGWYEGQLKTVGLEKLWSCKAAACGAGKGPKPLFGGAPIGDGDRVVTARLPRRELGDVYFAIHVRGDTTMLATAQTSATPEVKAEAAKEAAVAAAKITAATLNEALGRDGHATLGDILYKPGEVALRPEAAPAVQEIAKLLKETPELRLYVVGHTDDVGELKANLALSKRRAQWLVGQLRKAGVEAVRLRPDGVGPLAPVASNRTEAGRDRNRRVELVLQ